MLHFIVDGYNLIYRIKGIKKQQPLINRRRILIGRLEKFKLSMSPRNRVTVVFDGKEDVYSLTKPSGIIEVVFSKLTNADEVIKKMVCSAKAVKNIVVVTDDREIINYIKKLGAKHIAGDSFLKGIEKKREINLSDPGCKVDNIQAGIINREIRAFLENKPH